MQRFLTAGLLMAIFCGTSCCSRAQMSPALHMILGNPHPVPVDADHYFITLPQYTASYNDSLRFPNWVVWHLSKQDIGHSVRGQFAPDTTLPVWARMTVVQPSDYTNSGYDRGLNCPSKDRSATREDNDAVFLMTNVTPQAHGMKNGPWAALENYCRDLVFANNELFIYCGHGFNDKTSTTHKTIGPNKVAVPDFGWKIVVVVPIVPTDGGNLTNRLNRITPSTRVIAVKIPNVNTVFKDDWRKYRTSVQDIEAATGLVFFENMTKATADALKTRVDFDGPAAAPFPAAPTAPTVKCPTGSLP